MNEFVRIQSMSKRLVGSLTLSKLAAALGLFLALVASFAYIAKQVLDGDTVTRDSEILLKINSHSNTTLDFIALAVTYTGNILSVVIIAALLSTLLYKQKRIRSIVQLLFSIGGAIAANAMLKLIFQRDRPELWQLITHESTYSFPSGHSLITAALAATVILIFWKSRYRWLIAATAIAYTLSVGLSRLYLGVHYPTDVLAGWCLGIIWAMVVAAILRIIVIDHKKAI